MTIAVQGKKSLNDRIIAKLNRSRPQNEEGGTFRVTNTANDDATAKIKYVLLSGLRPLDQLTGGLPFGRVTEIYGMDQSGKTAIVIRSAIRAQQYHVYEKVQDPDSPAVELRRVDENNCDVTVLYIDNENSLSDPEKLKLYDEDKPDDPPTSLAAVEGDTDTIMQMFKLMDRTLEILDEEEEKSKRLQFLVVIVDTIASTSTAEEIKSEWGKVDYQRQPKQLREGFRRMIRDINRRNVCMICVNQISEKFNAGPKKRYGGNTPQDDDFSTFGGRALKYYASLRIFFYKLAPIKLSKGDRNAAGLLIGFKTIKNRQLPPLREGRLSLMFHRGYSDAMSVLETLIYTGFAVISKSNGNISFKFRRAGITPTTFTSELDAPRRKKDEEREDPDPEIESKLEWVPFYRAHSDDIDLLWDEAVKSAFAVGAQSSDTDDDDAESLIDEIGD